MVSRVEHLRQRLLHQKLHCDCSDSSRLPWSPAVSEEGDFSASLRLSDLRPIGYHSNLTVGVGAVLYACYNTRVTIANLHQPPTTWLENICGAVAPLQE